MCSEYIIFVIDVKATKMLLLQINKNFFPQHKTNIVSFKNRYCIHSVDKTKVVYFGFSTTLTQALARDY